MSSLNYTKTIRLIYDWSISQAAQDVDPGIAQVTLFRNVTAQVSSPERAARLALYPEGVYRGEVPFRLDKTADT